MVTDSSKALALVVSAIKNLRETKGSTSKEILHYLSSVYDIAPTLARRQMLTALKRGVAYGILKKNGPQYILPTNGDAKFQEVAEQEVSLLDVCRKSRMQRKMGCKCKKRRRRRRRRKSFCRCKSGRRRSRRRRSRRRRSRRRRSRRRRRQSRGCGRRRSRRRASRRRRSRGCGRKRRRRSKCRCGGLTLRGARDRMKRATKPDTNEKYIAEKSFQPTTMEANDTGPSENTSLSSMSSATD